MDGLIHFPAGGVAGGDDKGIQEAVRHLFIPFAAVIVFTGTAGNDTGPDQRIIIKFTDGCMF